MKPKQSFFWSKVNILSKDECWPWLASKTEDSYGQCWDPKLKKLRFAARMAWEFYNRKKFPKGKKACHSCDNPPCCNPRHIWPGTNQQNSDDMVAKGRSTKGFHCGENSPRARLSKCQVSNIRLLAKRKVSPTDLSRIFHVSRQHIKRIISKACWK